MTAGALSGLFSGLAFASGVLAVVAFAGFIAQVPTHDFPGKPRAATACLLVALFAIVAAFTFAGAADGVH